MEMIRTLAAELCGLTEADEILCDLCQAAVDSLRLRLKEGVTPESCGKAFWIAAAALAANAWQEGKGQAHITAFAMGSVSMQSGQEGDRFSTVALELLRPWLKDEGFAFQGVPT